MFFVCVSVCLCVCVYVAVAAPCLWHSAVLVPAFAVSLPFPTDFNAQMLCRRALSIPQHNGFV